VISAFEACSDFSGDEICAHCGWLEHEHEHATVEVEIRRAA